MLRAILILVVVTLACVSSAADSASEADSLVKNLAKWHNARIERYTFRLQFTGYVIGFGQLPAVRIRVRDGAVVDAKLLGSLGRLPAGSQAPRDPTMAAYFRLTANELFSAAADSIEYARAHPGATIRITYDPQFGFPNCIDGDDPEVSDSDGGYLVQEFEVSR